MAKYTLKLVSISESGSIGRQLKATVNGVSFGFTGSTSRHEIIAKDVEFSDAFSLPISVDVLEWDAKTSDTPYSDSTSITLDPTSKNNPTASVTISIKEVGGRGKNKGKTASVTFNFEAKIKKQGTVNFRFEPLVGIPELVVAHSGLWGQPFTNAEGSASSDSQSAHTYIKVWSSSLIGGACNTVICNDPRADAGAIKVFANATEAGKYKIYFDLTYKIITAGPHAGAQMKVEDTANKNAVIISENIKKAGSFPKNLPKKKLISVVVDLPENQEVQILRYDPTLAFPDPASKAPSSGSIDMTVEAVRNKLIG